jgi:hypothetical protein
MKPGKDEIASICDCLDLMDRGTELLMKFAEPTAASLVPGFMVSCLTLSWSEAAPR